MNKHLSFFCALLGLVVATGCSSGWTPEERSAFVQSCKGAAVQVSEPWPDQTCACVAKQLEQEHPNPNDLEDFLDSLRQSPMLLFDKYSACRVPTFETAAVWTPVAEKAFIESCNQAVKDKAVPDAALCPCILEKVKKRFASEQSMHRLNVEVLGFLAEECRGKRAPMLY